MGSRKEEVRVRGVRSLKSKRRSRKSGRNFSREVRAGACRINGVHIARSVHVFGTLPTRVVGIRVSHLDECKIKEENISTGIYGR